MSDQPRSDAWIWWQARRLTYNLALAVAGLAAVGLFWLLLFLMSANPPSNAPLVLSTSMLLLLGLLAVIALANLGFLLGPLLETWLKPKDVTAYRRRAWTVGFWGSVALPFLFPAATLAALLAAPV